ncbi:MAG: efflux RND transporter permease subunit, partial [Gemmatimonadetes bacterium]|nr:efflux RND transporter permease subunit [Gemmatimonadota bacterium]
MIDLSIKRPVATAAIYVALVALGAYSFRLIPVELLPDVDYPRLTVNASWGGASPEAMEAFVTSPLEAAAQQVKGVRKITSTSRADPRGTGSSAEIDIEFERDVRMDFAQLDLGERFASLRDELPPAVYPQIQPYVPREFSDEEQRFLSYQLHGPYTFSRLAEVAEEEVEPVLSSVDGVAGVMIWGDQDREVAIELDRQKLDALNLRPEQVEQRIRDLSTLRAPGSLVLEGRQVTLAVRTRVRRVSELENLVIVQRREGAIRLRDIGTVREQTADATSFFRINGQPTISIFVTRESGTNAVRVADAVKEAIGPLEARMPPGATLELDDDQSQEIRQQLTDLRLRALAAAIVIFLVLTLFLRSMGAVLVVFATIGFSVLIAVNMLYLGGFSLNVLTLAGLAWGFGLIVDNGIVVLENVERHSHLGKPARQAASDGARQVMLPVIAATATTAIVLVPFLFLQGELRIYYLPLAFAVAFSIVASLFVAFTFVPTMAGRIHYWRARVYGVPAGTADQAAGAARETASAEASGVSAAPATARPRVPAYIRAYRSVLGFALDHPILVVAVCVAALGGSWWLFDKHVTRGIRWSAFWGQDTYISVNITFPRGAGLDRTDEMARAFEEKISSIPEVERYEAWVQPQYAFMRITFPKDLETTQVPVAIKEQMVAYSYQFSGADVRVYGYGPSFYGGGSSPPNYSLKILGYNYLQVQDLADDLASRLERFSRIQDVDPNASGRWYERDKEFEYYLAVDREALGAHDITVEELLRFVSANLPSDRPRTQVLRVGAEELPFAVKLGGYRDFDLIDMRQLRIPSQTGREVRLADVAQVERRNVLSRILREDQQYQRTVAWEFRGPRKLGDLIRDAVVEATTLPPGYKIEEDDRWGWDEEEKTQVYVAIIFAVLLIYMVTAALFESLAAPFVVLLTLPLALIGVFLIFFYADATFTRTAYIGTIMMAGIVVNNAILIVYHIGELRQSMPTRDAILQGTLERVRPILMTTFTTVFGLLPLVLFAQSQDENIWNSLALATIGGLISSTLFVLVAVPVAY